MNWFAALIIRPAAVVAVAWLILRIFRVQHPASQHTVWSVALGGMLVIVPLSFVMPRWNIAAWRAKESPSLHAVQSPQPSDPGLGRAVELATASVSRTASTPRQPNLFRNSGALLLLLYLLGMFAVAGRQFIGRFLLVRLIRRAKPVTGCLRESNDVVVPVTGGLFSPTVVLPRNWRQWSWYTRRLVLRHEFAHIRRGDLLNSAFADCVRSLLWFHPAAWWLSLKTATLAEMACDAVVVETLASPGAYCRLLLKCTEQVAQAGHRVTLPGLAMAGPTSLNLRIERIFAVSNGGLRKLTRPKLVLTLGMLPALCLAAALDISKSATPAWRSAPFRVLMFLQGEHVGKLKPELVPNSVIGQTEPMEPAIPQERAALPVSLAPEDLVFTGATFFDKNGVVKLALVEPAEGEPYLFADINQNGSLEHNERFLFMGPEREVVLKLPMSAGPYRYYPIRLSIPRTDLYRRDASGKTNGGGRTLLRSPFAFVEGTVDIGGKNALVRYMFDMDKGSAYPDWGWQGMDTNGDGRIDERANSDEWTFARDESVIFNVNGHNVSTLSLDLKSGTFVVREHPAGDNKRILLRVGDLVPDFSYADLDGKSHRFFEFRGKYVLLDFWGTWCGPCRRELPDLEKAYQQFRQRGLVIIGMGDDNETDKVRKVLSNAGVTYPQSSGELGNALVYKRFRIDRFPTKMLLNPEGKVLALDFDGSFDREHLTSTLDKLLPSAK